MYEKDRGKEDQEHTTKATYLRDTIWSNNQHIVRFFYERTDFLMERIPPEKKKSKTTLLLLRLYVSNLFKKKTICCKYHFVYIYYMPYYGLKHPVHD